MSYYDLDAILTDAEKVPCKFNLELPDLGYLDNNPSAPLKPQTTVSLPLWLAELLALTTQPNVRSQESNPFLTLNLPCALSQDIMSALKADPRAVPLRDQSSNFFALGTRMLDLFDDREMCAILRKTFVVRAGEVALHARKAGASEDVGTQGDEFLRGLEGWERSLFRRAHDSYGKGREWMEGVKK